MYHVLEVLEVHLLLLSLGRFSGGVVAAARFPPPLVWAAALAAPSVPRGPLPWGCMRSSGELIWYQKS